MRILFLSRWFPFPYDNGAKIRVYNVIAQLARSHEVHLVSFCDESTTPQHIDEMRKVCPVEAVIEYKEFHPGRLRALVGYFSPFPRSVVDTFSRSMMDAVQTAGRRFAFDMLVASQIDMAPYIQSLAVPVKVLEELEVSRIYTEYVQEPRSLRRLRKRLTWYKQQNYLRKLADDFSAFTVVSTKEASVIRQLLPPDTQVVVVPNGVDIERYKDFYRKVEPEEDSLIYSGSLTYGPNFEAVEFFLNEVIPLVAVEFPRVKLYVTGRTEGVPLDRLPHKNCVEFTGFVEDLRPLLAGCWLNVVPLKTGGGTRLKILESLAIGTPVVSTAKGAEGLDLEPGKDLLIADNANDFARAVISVLRDRHLRDQLSTQGHNSVALKYDWNLIAKNLLSLIQRVGSDTSSR